ncbi:MAG TPA: 50S ribosomal protein L4 [Chloroflexi bacterium]|nr:50S ribosomal protein L4 [Chloroflexota bacterium]
MVTAVYNTKGEPVGEIELRSDIFESSINVPLMHQAFVRQMANSRQGTHKAKSRGEVNRTKSKWYRQKGTGRARHGSRNANLFVGGGVAHGPTPRNYVKRMPRKMRHAAIRSALSVKALDEQIVVLDALEMAAPKTKEIASMLGGLGLDVNKGKTQVLILLPEGSDMVEKSARNLPSVKTLRANYLNIRDLLQCDHVLMPISALEVIEEMLG